MTPNNIQKILDNSDLYEWYVVFISKLNNLEKPSIYDDIKLKWKNKNRELEILLKK